MNMFYVLGPVNGKEEKEENKNVAKVQMSDISSSLHPVDWDEQLKGSFLKWVHA